jgi:hypothetical protein
MLFLRTSQLTVTGLTVLSRVSTSFANSRIFHFRLGTRHKTRIAAGPASETLVWTAPRQRITKGGHVAAAGLNGAVTLKAILDRAPE